MEFVIGADPEVFVRSGKKSISAAGYVPGTKEDPFVVDNGALQVDGMALEFNVNPVSDKGDWWKNIKSVVEDLKTFLPEGQKLDLNPVAYFGGAYIDSQPKENKELGCSPDYNAYTGKLNPVPNAETPFRTSSGHIHVGWTDGADVNDKAHFEACQFAAMQLDYSVGLLSLFFGDAAETRKRRELYGKAGAFRPKSYGMEYRTPDSYWLRSKKHINLVFDLVMTSMKDLSDGYYYFDEHFAGVSNKELQRIINEADLEAAQKVIEQSPILSSFDIPRKYTGVLMK